MARKGKRKKNQSKSYTKKEFKEVFCSACGMCQDADPAFCYEYLYKGEARRFVNGVFRNLTDLVAFMNSRCRALSSMSVEQFSSAVCQTGICYQGNVDAAATCSTIDKCYQDFRKQMGCKNSVVVHENQDQILDFGPKKKRQKRHKKGKKKGKLVFQAYPSFFVSGDEEFRATVRRILYGDNDQQQDSNKGLSSGASGASSGGAESKES
jgi:hypothetical protein